MFACFSLMGVGGMAIAGYTAPRMSPEMGCAHFSSFISLRRAPHARHSEVMLALHGSSADAQREKAVMRVCRSEIKEEGRNGPGDIRGGRPASPPSTQHVSREESKRRQAKWAK